MKEKSTLFKPLIVLVIFLLLIFAFMSIANQLQRDFGAVEVSTISISTDTIRGGELIGTLYRPASATAENPAPAMLLLHGYQNDKGATASLATELSRRGYVVLSLDQYGHGFTNMGMAHRGYVNHRVTTIFGEDSIENGTFRAISGPIRYRVMLNFSNLSFFHDRYIRDEAGNVLNRSDMGGINAFAALGSLEFVDETRTSVGGHSMGTWSSWTVAAAFSNETNEAGESIAPRAVVLQAGELFTPAAYDYAHIHFNNVLLLTAKYDEFANFRDYNNTVTQDLPASPLRSGFLGVPTGEGRWDTTFGDFTDGSARRMELVITNHRLVAVNSGAIALTLDWLDEANGHTSILASNQQNFQLNALLVLLSMLLALGAMVPFLSLLLRIPFFQEVGQKLPSRIEKFKTTKKWWKGAVITMLIACFTYPFMSQLGHGLLPLPEGVFRMTIGNGFLAWYLLLIIVMILTTVIPWCLAKKRGKQVDYYDLGLTTLKEAKHINWRLLGKSAILAFIMVGLVYVLVTVFVNLYGLDFRIIWPFFRPFNLLRLGQFFLYLPIFALFFILNNMKIFGQMGQKAAFRPGFKGFLSCWWRGAVCMAGGIFLVCLIQYIPFFLNIGPGADLLFGATFGGPFMSLLLILFPQIIVLSVLCTLLYRKTGHVYVSGLVAGLVSCWIIAGGSPFL